MYEFEYIDTKKYQLFKINYKMKPEDFLKTTLTNIKVKLTSTSILIDIENLNNDSFREMLGYINTIENEQIKGNKGRLR